MMTDKEWRETLRIVGETFAEYLSGMAALRRRLVGDLKRKLSDSKVLDHPDLEQPLPQARPASRHRRPRGRRSGV